MYDPHHLKSVLVSVLGPAASSAVNDSPIRVMISATAMNGHDWFFVKDHPKNSRSTGTVKLIDAAIASACAPTYFDHWTIDGIMGQTMRLFDGGAGGTANPTYQAGVEAWLFPAPDMPPHGILQTVSWTASTLVDAREDWVHDAVNRQWPGVMINRNPLLPRNIDEADLSAIPDLVKTGQQLAAAMDWRQILGI
jgi:hypothetical protein